MLDPIPADAALAAIDEVRAERDQLRIETERLRTALGMAVYHADNLRNYIDRKVVRDLDESAAGLEAARRTLMGWDAEEDGTDG